MPERVPAPRPYSLENRWNRVMDELAALPRESPTLLSIEVLGGSNMRALSIEEALSEIGLVSPWSLTYHSKIRKGSEIFHKVVLREEPIPGIYRSYDLVVRVQETKG